MRLFIAICLFAAMGTAQTMVESAILTGATATAGTKAKGAGNSIGKIFGKVNGTLSGAAAQGTAPSSSVAAAERAASAAPAQPVLPKPSKADFEGVEKGMPRAELIAKVGKPASALSMTEDGRLEETLRFNTKEGSSARVKVTDGKVSSIEWPPAQ
jgi:hypothetical protein